LVREEHLGSLETLVCRKHQDQELLLDPLSRQRRQNLPEACSLQTAGNVAVMHRSGADMPFLSAVAAAVSEVEPGCTVLLTADNGASRSSCFLTDVSAPSAPAE